MSYVTMTTMACGVILSAFAGFLCYFGAGCVESNLYWLPHVNLLLSNPQAVLGIGAALIALSLACQPGRIE